MTSRHFIEATDVDDLDERCQILIRIQSRYQSDQVEIRERAWISGDINAVAVLVSSNLSI